MVDYFISLSKIFLQVCEEINPHHIPILSGLAIYRADAVNGCQTYSLGEITTQIEIGRAYEDIGYTGHIHFSEKYLKRGYEMKTKCQNVVGTFTHFDGHSELQDAQSPYLLLKQSSYNHFQAETVPGLAYGNVHENWDLPGIGFQNEK